jgi:transcriptional regulator of acetoin/glycerol metabolism
MSNEETDLRRALADAKGSPAKAAELLGVSRMTVWRRMKKYGLTVERVVKRAA